MSLFRSETMNYFKIVFPDSHSYQILSMLGQLGKLHFVDRNPGCLTHDKPFSRIIRKCGELEEMLEQIQKIMIQFEVPIRSEPNPERFFRKLEERVRAADSAPESILGEMEHIISENSLKIKEMQSSFIDLQEQLDLCLEELCLLKIIQRMLPKNFQYKRFDNLKNLCEYYNWDGIS